jgi:hypothetical protein
VNSNSNNSTPNNYGGFGLSVRTTALPVTGTVHKTRQFFGDNPMKKIPLSQEQFALVDDEDFAELSKHKWYAFRRNKEYSYYAIRNIGIKPNRGSERMHNVIMKPPKGFEVDHKDGNGLNNQRYNLRVCSRSQNMGNTRGQRRNSSRYKGVHWDSRNNNWRPMICKNYKILNLGSFKSEVEAAKAYDAKAKELYGEFACLNFPIKVVIK